MTPEQKAAAAECARDHHCFGSDGDIKCDADSDSPDTDFAPAENGVYVKGWLWVPKERIPGYTP